MEPVPSVFHTVFNDWRHRGEIDVHHRGWTNRLERYVRAEVTVFGQRGFAKMAVKGEKDLDEPDKAHGIIREVWWSRVISELRRHDPAFPFSSPKVICTNVDSISYEKDNVAWVIFEWVDGKPIVSWEVGDDDKHAAFIALPSFDDMVEMVFRCHHALAKVQPHTIQAMNLPSLPYPPHGMRAWQKRGMFNPSTVVLSNGSFEPKNFWRTNDKRLMLIDNEFAGWYPKYDGLSYLYHRLYCNAMRPDLARRMFDTLVRSLRRDEESEFAQEFPKLLRARLLGGWYYDMMRRKLRPWHIKQRLRYKLLWYLLRSNWPALA